MHQLLPLAPFSMALLSGISDFSVHFVGPDPTCVKLYADRVTFGLGANGHHVMGV